MNIRRIIISIVIACATWAQAGALSLALDSIAEWGRFPRFCIDVYRWGDGFFNGYDSTYVVGTGYKFNGKLRADSWIDSYNFYLPDNVRMQMSSEPSTSMGARLTYLAVSVGYDKNISKFFGRPDSKARKQFTFGFDCSLFSVNMHVDDNTTPTRITTFGRQGQTIHPDIEFDGLKSKSFGIDAYYFFNHKRYSQAAAFNFSRIQVQSQGSWYAGATYSNQDFEFDFSRLPGYMLDVLPESWEGYKYHANTKNVALKVGYGYNWVFAPKWLLAVSESPTLGLKIGTINERAKHHTAPTFSNQLRVSVVWNHKQWFAGAVGEYNTALFYDKETVFQNSALSGVVNVGYRFNLW